MGEGRREGGRGGREGRNNVACLTTAAFPAAPQEERAGGREGRRGGEGGREGGVVVL